MTRDTGASGCIRLAGLAHASSHESLEVPVSGDGSTSSDREHAPQRQPHGPKATAAAREYSSLCLGRGPAGAGHRGSAQAGATLSLQPPSTPVKEIPHPCGQRLPSQAARNWPSD